MSRLDEIIAAYAANTRLIGQLIEGLGHDESLLQPPFTTNYVNWIPGHIKRSNLNCCVVSFSPKENQWGEC